MKTKIYYLALIAAASFVSALAVAKIQRRAGGMFLVKKKCAPKKNVCYNIQLKMYLAPKQSTFFLFRMDQNQKQLIKLAHTKMPFGKYEGRFLIDLPEYYVVWYHNKGFPKGELGEQLQLVYELKLNGLEELIRNIKKRYPKPH